MDLSVEIEVMRLLEQALALPTEQRQHWLEAQHASAQALSRVHELLAAEQETDQFLETPLTIDASVSDAALPIAGDRLGAWELLGELDSGGMGVVFLARRADGAYEQQAAIKFVRTGHLPLSTQQRGELIKRFENERRLLARLDHPNIARILDGGSTLNGMPYLVMEYVHGYSIAEHCDHQHLDIAARITLFAKVCDGVQAAHRHLIVHRDLKPQNILVGADGEPRLLDFGIARALDTVETGPSGATQTATLAMTPAYASPEQMRLEPLTTASDVYSLGIVLYELLAGMRPYSLDGLSPAQSERVVCDTEPHGLRRALAAGTLPLPERRARLARISQDLERIVAKALHKEPERRYGSAQALAEDLRRHLDGRPVLAHPDSMGYRMGKFLHRHRLGAATAALALIAVITAAGVAFWQAGHARQAAQDTQQVNAFLSDIINHTNPYTSNNPGDITLTQAVDEASQTVGQRFAGRTDLATDIRLTLAESMVGRHRLDQAEALLRTTLREAESAFGPNDVRTARAVGLLASIQMDHGKLSQAQAGYQDALARLRHAGQKNTALYTRLLDELGTAYGIAGDNTAAEAMSRESMAIAVTLRPPLPLDEIARKTANLAIAARVRGDLDEAERLYAQAIPMFETAYPDGSPWTAIVLNNRARLAWDRDDYELARALLHRAIAMDERFFKDDHVNVMMRLANLSHTYSGLHDYDAAIAWAERATAMAERLYPDSPHHLLTLPILFLAQAHLGAGQVDQAAAHALRAQRMASEIPNFPEPRAQLLASVLAAVCAEPAAAAHPPCQPDPSAAD